MSCNCSSASGHVHRTACRAGHTPVNFGCNFKSHRKHDFRDFTINWLAFYSYAGAVLSHCGDSRVRLGDGVLQIVDRGCPDRLTDWSLSQLWQCFRDGRDNKAVMALTAKNPTSVQRSRFPPPPPPPPPPPQKKNVKHS